MQDDRLGRYRLIRRIGAGGMAEVFRAELVGAEGVARELVVKRIHHVLALDPAAVAMFVNEARIAARLRHPNVVQVYEFGRAGGAYFLAMELVEGCDLAAVVRDAAARGERLPLGVVGHALAEVLEGIGYVHELADERGAPMGLVHRDVSPHNVLLSTEGEVKLADFGIAKAGALATTGPANVRGKFAYMSPEQARGEALDARTDLFAVGVMLYEMLAGRRPHVARDDGDVLDAVREGATEPLARVAPAVHPALARVADRAIAADRAARFPDARAFRDALLDALAAAGAHPDRAALRARVRVVAGLASRDARPERTLTVDEAAPPADPPEAPAAPAQDEDEDAPADAPAPPDDAPPPRRRKLLDRAVVLLGVAVVSALAGLRVMRPSSRVAAPGAHRADAARRVVRVAVPGRGAGAWLAADALRDLERRCACRVALAPVDGEGALDGMLREGEVDVALVAGGAAGALARGDAVRRLDVLLAEVDAARWAAARGALRPGALALGRRTGAAGEGTYLAPAVVEAVVLAYRPSLVRAAAEAFPAARPALEARLRDLTGRGLPVGYTLRASPDGWTTWDLLAAAWTWARDPAGPGGRVWVPTGPGASFLRAWRARVAAATPAGAAGAREARVTALGWDVVFGALGLFHASVAGEAAAPDLRDGSIAAAYALASDVARADDAADLAVARLPRGDALALDAVGDPVQAGRHAAVVEAWGWVIGRGSAQAGTAARLVLAALEAPAVRALAARTALVPARGDVELSVRAGVPGRVASHLAEALSGGRVEALDLGRRTGLPATAAGEWALWVRAVRGGAGLDDGRWSRARLEDLATEGVE